MISLFQTAAGAWHLPSILLLVGWLLSGGIVFANLVVNRADRLQAAERDAPFQLGSEKEAALLASLSSAPKGNVAIEYSAADAARSHPFATALKATLEKAGYPVWGYMPAFQQTGNASPLVGIWVGMKPGVASQTGTALAAALVVAGYPVSTYPIQNNNYEDSYAVVIVGMKNAPKPAQ